jgi:hypothetical protein
MSSSAPRRSGQCSKRTIGRPTIEKDDKAEAGETATEPDYGGAMRTVIGRRRREEAWSGWKRNGEIFSRTTRDFLYFLVVSRSHTALDELCVRRQLKEKSRDLFVRIVYKSL